MSRITYVKAVGFLVAVVILALAFAISLTHPFLASMTEFSNEEFLFTDNGFSVPRSHFSFLSKASFEKVPEKTTFVALGHIYNIATCTNPAYLDIYRKMIRVINDSNPEVVFLLGDLTWDRTEWDWKILKNLLIEEINAPVIVAAGNHEFQPMYDSSGYMWWNTEDLTSQYHKEVPYLHTRFETPEANFITLGTPDRPKKTVNFLKESLKKANLSKPTIVLTHHYISGYEWQDRLGIRPKDGEKYFFQGQINHLIGGDHLKSYTVDTTCFGGIGITCHGVGMEGQDKPYDLYIVYGEIDNAGNVSMTPKVIPLQDTHPIFGGSRLPKTELLQEKEGAATEEKD